MTQTKPTAKIEPCARCNGKGVIEGFRHVKAGVCFRCWGCGQNIMGEIRRLERELARWRRVWLGLSRKAKTMEPCSQQSRTVLDKLERVEVRGKRVRALLDATVRDYESLAAKHKTPAL